MQAGVGRQALFSGKFRQIADAPKKPVSPGARGNHEVFATPLFYWK